MSKFDCIWWGENRTEDDFQDIGCLIGHCLCKNEDCEDYAKSLVVTEGKKPKKSRMYPNGGIR